MKRKSLIVFILTLGVFGIINTEMGIIGLLPTISEHYHVSISQAGLLVSLFALIVALSGSTLPLVFSGINRKMVMLLVLGVFILGNIVSTFAPNFAILLIARVVPAFFHPIYCSLAFTVAAASVSKEEAPRAVSKVIIGVSGGMVLGVPVSSLIASTTSLGMAMIFFAVINATAFIATLIFVPSMPVKERLSYGAQLSVLKKPIVMISIIGVIFMNGAVFGVFSYLADYLESVTRVPVHFISLLLLVYGGANIVGSIIAGKLLIKNAVKSTVIFPFALGIIYIILFLTGQLTVPMALITLAWGILGGVGANINQYWITSAAPEAPDFANGLFITSTNLGTTAATTVCGFFISGIGPQYVVLGGFLFLVLSALTVFMRVSMDQPKKQLSK
ncbi:MFS transporter [Sporolactobacillus laevolacticus]|uniref:MFS transporter n=1 Tax=Sporolactobacillus laevolacticus TaxID=33018 RepID=UPI0025B5BB48|nr:MFS transporter [Sporolactobacillus laevolacticus]MDN3955935.1 MFS transporter [Sporolactobacillus laevolacticus]